MSHSDTQLESSSLADILCDATVESVQPCVETWLSKRHSAFYGGKTDSQVWYLLEKQQENLLKLSYYRTKAEEYEQKYVQQGNNILALTERLNTTLQDQWINDNTLVLNDSEVRKYFVEGGIEDDDYKQEDFASKVQECIQGCEEEVGIQHPTWDIVKWKGRSYPKCVIHSQVIVCDKNLQVQYNGVRATRQRESGDAIFGKDEEERCFVEVICSMCDGDICVFGYPTDSTDAGGCFVCVPASIGTEVEDALAACGMTNLVVLSQRDKRLRKTLCIAMFGENLVQPYRKRPNAKDVCLFVHDRRQGKKLV
jgi:hypothetical protein